MFEVPGKYTTAKIFVNELDPELVGQLTLMINHPTFTNPVAVMPDTHVGKGCVVGFTMKLTDSIIPNVVGVDIGCGMLAVKIGEMPNIDPLELDEKIRKSIPFGFSIHNSPVVELTSKFFLNIQEQAIKLATILNKTSVMPTYSEDWFKGFCKRIGIDLGKAICSVGTLGGGNHFIEIGKDSNNDHWIIVHSGSRNLGLKTCEHWQKIAVKRLNNKVNDELHNGVIRLKENCDKKDLQREINKLKEKLSIPNVKLKGMESLEGDDLLGYLFDMVVAQQYAKINRATMMTRIIDIFEEDKNFGKDLEYIDTVHNYINFEDLIIRKGAIRSIVGEKMIIPLNMRDGILLCEGKSNPEWLCSAPHGAGRNFSRSKAKSILTVEQFEKDMEGIFSTSVNRATIDEAPRAYKDSKMIEEMIEPTAKIIDKIIPIHNMKA